MRPLAEDTNPDAERVLIELPRSASPARKLAMVLSANRTARALTGCANDIRANHPRNFGGVWPTFGRVLIWPRAPTARCPIMNEEKRSQ
ncbi:MAG TPA: hypothetical protein VJW76_02170 [Verrucomicrobiae bacterium]|nr:hypothetical protein [Verrucomicrobiae bacterium]